MRLLADENISGAVVAALRDDGHDVVWMRTEAPGSSDREVLLRATRERRVVLTFDTDFGALAAGADLPNECGIILMRLLESSPAKLATAIAAIVRARTDWHGHLSIVEPDRVRMRKLGWRL